MEPGFSLIKEKNCCKLGRELSPTVGSSRSSDFIIINLSLPHSSGSFCFGSAPFLSKMIGLSDPLRSELCSSLQWFHCQRVCASLLITQAKVPRVWHCLNHLTLSEPKYSRWVIGCSCPLDSVPWLALDPRVAVTLPKWVGWASALSLWRSQWVGFIFDSAGVKSQCYCWVKTMGSLSLKFYFVYIYIYI